MNRKITLVLCSLFFSLFEVLIARDTHLEIRTAAFIPSEQRFRSIYGDVGCCYQIEATTEWLENLDLWANVDYFSRPGRAIGGHRYTHISLINFSYGIRHLYFWRDNLVPYIGIGFNLSSIRLNNHALCSKHKHSKIAIGG